MPRILLALLLVLLCTAAPAGAKLRDLGPLPGSLAGTDGERYAVGMTFDTAVYLVDLATGDQRPLPVPRGCSLRGVGRREVVFNCPPSRAGDPYVAGVTVDLRTAEERRLPSLQPQQIPGDYASYVDAGREWAELAVGGYHYGFSAYVNRRTGEVRRDSGNRRLTADLDHPGLERRLCAPLRRPLVVDDNSGFGIEVGPLRLAGRWAAAETFTDRGGSYSGRLLLQRCGRPARVITRCKAASCAAVVDDDGTLAWTEVPHRGPAATTVHIRSGRAGRTRSFTRPGTWSLFVAGHRLYSSTSSRLVEIPW